MDAWPDKVHVPFWNKKGLNDLVTDPIEPPISVKPYSDWVDDMAARGAIVGKGGGKGGLGKAGADKKRGGFQEKAAALMVHYENGAYPEFAALARKFEQAGSYMFKDILRKFRRNGVPVEE